MKQPNIPLLSPLNPFLEIKINTQLLLLSAPALPAEPGAGEGSQSRMEPGAGGAGKSCSEEIWVSWVCTGEHLVQVRGDIEL